MADEWISLGEAAKVLGVHPTTIRNWADQGDLPFRRTPGRHRRFHRALIEEWATQQKKRPDEKNIVATNPHAQVLVEYALGHTRFGVEEGDIRRQEWYGRISPEGLQQSRVFGRRILDALLRHLQDERPEDEELQTARQIGQEYAQLLLKEGLTLVEAIRGYVYFDDFLIEAVVQMMAPNMSSSPSEWSDLLRQINAFTNEVLVAMTQRYTE